MGIGYAQVAGARRNLHVTATAVPGVGGHRPPGAAAVDGVPGRAYPCVMTLPSGSGFAPRAGLALISVATLALLAGCLPADPGAMGVRPTLVTVQVPVADGSDTSATDVVLQGRYLTGAGDAGDRVVVGANAECEGGTEVAPSTWTTSRVVFPADAAPGSGFVCVVVNGVASNALPLDLD